MSIYENAVVQPKKMLENLGRWLEKAVDHAKQKSFEPDTLLSARLAPDAYSLVRQVQAACDSGKFPAARLSAKQPPSHPDTEKTMQELRERVRATIAYLETFKPADFEGSDTKKVALPFLEGKLVGGADYLREMGLPNFYFHVTMAYAILRHNGVDLGKRDFIGGMTLHDA
jgi:hypothetical protein